MIYLCDREKANACLFTDRQRQLSSSCLIHYFLNPFNYFLPVCLLDKHLHPPTALLAYCAFAVKQQNKDEPVCSLRCYITFEKSYMIHMFG